MSLKKQNKVQADQQLVCLHVPPSHVDTQAWHTLPNPNPNLPEENRSRAVDWVPLCVPSPGGLQAQPTHLCPLISATSVMPPTLKRKYSRPRARAMERAMLVLPTPGGPWKQRILPCVEPRSWLTAMNSCGSQDGSVHGMQTPRAKTKGLQGVTKAGLTGAVAEVGQGGVGSVNHVRGPSSTA